MRFTTRVPTLMAVLACAATLTAQTAPPALLQMADAERAFAKRAQDTTVRQAFIDFFADESVAFEPEPVAARESLRKRTTPPPSGFQLLWEPRLGDVAASGDLGYLTGPSETLVPGKPPQYGNYFSVWKRQADGQFKVILDVGGGTPAKPAYAPGFVRAAPNASWKGSESKSAAEASLLAADQAFAAATAAKGVAAAYTAAMHPDARFFRNGYQPMTSRQAAIDWMAAQVKAWATEPVKVETGASGDLGYTWGKYTVTPSARAAYSGYYVRVWTRKADGAWQVVAEVMSPPPPPPPAGH